LVVYQLSESILRELNCAYIISAKQWNFLSLITHNSGHSSQVIGRSYLLCSA